MPGIPIPFDPPSDWKQATESKCRGCDSDKVLYRIHESSCGGYEDAQFRCERCGFSWWVDGIDS